MFYFMLTNFSHDAGIQLLIMPLQSIKMQLDVLYQPAEEYRKSNTLNIAHNTAKVISYYIWPTKIIIFLFFLRKKKPQIMILNT